MKRAAQTALALTALILIVGSGAVPAVAQPAASVVTTAPYVLDFTLPTEGKAGCTVCHGDPNLTRLKSGIETSYFVNPDAYAKSAHGTTQCVGCHLDFGYSAPHKPDTDWSLTAKTACKNCHEQQFTDFGQGAHRRSLDATGTAAQVELTKPLCGDCHGSHEMEILTDSPEGQRAVHDRGWEICGRCHEDTWASYDDYYHGAAYKRGAPDAPACWDCHGWHDIVVSTDRRSRVNEAHLAETCGQTGCHTGVDENYVTYAAAIHGKVDVKQNNPIYALLKRIVDAVRGLFGGE